MREKLNPRTSNASVNFCASTESAVRLTLRGLIITWREEMAKEPARDKEDDAGCSAEA